MGSRGSEQWARSPTSVLSPVEGFLPHSILYPNFSNPALNMLLALPMLLFCLSLSEGMSLVQEERLAFMLCESDGEEGLTWAEVKDCEDRFAYLLTEMGQAVPTEEDFNKADLDSDGTLKFEEWAAWSLNA